MSVLAYQVTHLPDLDKTEYHARYGDDPASRLAEMQTNFLYTLRVIASEYPLSCSLVYYYNPEEVDEDKKLQIFVRLHFENKIAEADLKQVKKIFKASFWRYFYNIEEVSYLGEIDLSWVKFISFGIKQEEKKKPVIIRKDEKGKITSPSYYYLIQPIEPNDEVDKVGFCSKIETYDNKSLIEVVIKPTTLFTTEQAALENMLRVLNEQSSYDVKKSEISGKLVEHPKDPVADRACKQFEDLQEAIQSQPLYEFSIRVLAESRFNASLLLNEFWVESSQNPLYREIAIGLEDAGFSRAIESVKEGTLFPEAIWADYWNHVSQDSPLLKLKRLHRLFTIEETSSFFKVVVPDSVVVFNGIRKETDLKSSNTSKNILLGWQAGKPKNQALLPLKNLNKHVFICGVPGSGKTTAVLNLLFQLWTEHGIPFLVIEPAKTEYRSMLKCTYDEVALSEDDNSTTSAYIKTRDVPNAIAKMQTDLQIYSLGNERVCPFRFNPFVFYGNTTLDEHISTLEACFKGAMPLFGPLPALLAEAIEQVYAQLGWQAQDTAEYGIKLGREFPNMQELYEAITAIFQTKQYSSDVAGDIKTALEVRIGGLLRRSVGNMLNTRTSSPDIANLMQRPVILEMDSLNEEQANLMTMFILATLRQYTRVMRKSGSSLKHIAVIEEAHNIVGANNQESGTEDASNPKEEATKYIVRMLAEMRALGEGIIIADQLPSAVAPEVIKNTNVKLAHRTVSGDDREILQQSMLLTGTQSEELARSNPGDAYLFMEGVYKPVRIKEPDTKSIYGIEEPPSDDELVKCIEGKEFYQRAIANKTFLYRQKVNQRVVVVRNQLESISNNCFKLIVSGNELLQVSLDDDKELTKFALLSEQLEEFTQRLVDVIESNKTQLDKIWNTARQQGIYDALKSELIVQTAHAGLQTHQQELEELQSRCKAKNAEVKNKIQQLADSLYLKSVTILTKCEHLYRKKIDSESNNWQKIAKFASESDVTNLKYFCNEVQGNIAKQRLLSQNNLDSTNAHKFASASAKDNYRQQQNIITELNDKLVNLSQSITLVDNQKLSLKQSFNKLRECFNSYKQQADKVLEAINQSVSSTDVQLAYKDVMAAANKFYRVLDEYEQIETDAPKQLAQNLSEEIETMVNQINLTEENITKAYQLRYR